MSEGNSPERISVLIDSLVFKFINLVLKVKITIIFTTILIMLHYNYLKASAIWTERASFYLIII